MERNLLRVPEFTRILAITEEYALLIQILQKIFPLPPLFFCNGSD
jgi:hypothetical protein